MEENNTYMDYSGKTKNQDSKTTKRPTGKKYQSSYRKKIIRKEVILSKHNSEFLQQSAAKYRQSFSEHIQKCAIAYLKNTVLLVNDAQLQNLRFEIRKIGVNINQIAYKVNRDGKEHFDERELYSLLKGLEITINNYAHSTLSIETLAEAIKNSRITLDQLTVIMKS